METAAIYIGSGLIVLVAVQVITGTVVSVLSLSRQTKQNRLSNLFMLERIEAVRALRERESKNAWNGFRKFVVRQRIEEAKGTASFCLEPHDGRPLPAFKPGQFLTFQLDVPTEAKPVIRCYSLSDGPRPDRYRVSIKRVPAPRKEPDAPPGLVSNFFHDHVNEGDILDVRAPSGHFFMDPLAKPSAVLIAGGVGITPMVSMLRAIVDSGGERQATLFYGVRNGEDHALKDELTELSSNHPNIRVVTCYSGPRAGHDVKGQDYDQAGRVTVEVMKEYIKTSNHRYFMCGPPPFMKSVTDQLGEWGVPKDHIYSEAFGPASIKAKSKKPKDAAEPAAAAVEAVKVKVTFSRSGKEIGWDAGKASSLLDLAEANGIEIDSGCRTGGCGTCKVAIKTGSVKYESDPDCDIESGCGLACVACPDGDLVVDA
ncbi:MAG: hypothetical protein CMJ59_02505 [Planctomycetaceae bacterium]|nr:hypothetical protein [Planctomycetaceae bacterium]